MERETEIFRLLILLLAKSNKELEQKLAESSEALLHHTHYDLLTGLPNRALLFEQVAQEIFNANYNKTWLALYFIDLDGTRLINDSLTHVVGDQLLKAVAKRL